MVFLPYLHKLEAKITIFDEANNNFFFSFKFFFLSILSKQELLNLNIFVTALMAFSVAVLFSTERLSGAVINANNPGNDSAHAQV